MALSKKIKTANGVELNYHVINHIIVNKEAIYLEIDSFTDKTYYNKAIKKQELIDNQEELIKSFNELNEKEDLTNTEKNKLDKYATQINELANEITEAKDYNNYVLGRINIQLPYSNDFSIASLEKDLLNTEQFKLARIVK